MEYKVFQLSDYSLTDSRQLTKLLSHGWKIQSFSSTRGFVVYILERLNNVSVL